MHVVTGMLCLKGIEEVLKEKHFSFVTSYERHYTSYNDTRKPRAY